MQWIEAKITFSSDNAALAMDLIADAFYSLNTKGVVIDDPLLESEHCWAPDTVKRPSRPAVTGYLQANHQFEDSRHTLERLVSRLAGVHLADYTIDYRSIDEEDWAHYWKAFFRPQMITSRILVKPTWWECKPQEGQLVLEIDPGMAFGTGTHPTTSLCIKLLEKHLRAGDTVLDVGTGSGILLIAAAKLGACRMVGIDSDAMAVDVAHRNLIQNSIDLSAVELRCGHLLKNAADTYDVVVANILAEIIIELLDDVAKVVEPGGLFICSGIIKAHQTGVEEKMTACGLDLLDHQQDEDWVALVGRRR